eukprot:6186795-Pleurochrysis_carterae.AAC.1
MVTLVKFELLLDVAFLDDRSLHWATRGGRARAKQPPRSSLADRATEICFQIGDSATPRAQAVEGLSDAITWHDFPRSDQFRFCFTYAAH